MWRPLLPLYLQELGAGAGQIGLFFTLGAIAPLLFQVFCGWLSEPVGRLQAIAIGSLAGVAGYVVYILAPTWQWLLLATATGAMATSFVAPSYMAFIAEESTEQTRGRVYGLSSTLIDPAYNSLISKAVLLKLRGTAFGLFSTSIGIISLPAPYLGTMLWERFTPQFPFYIPLVATLLLLPIMWLKFKLPPSNPEADQGGELAS